MHSCKTCRKLYADKYRSDPKNKDRAKNRAAVWRASNQDKVGATSRAYRQRLKTEAIAAYGGVCDCCNESREVFLAIDHVNGGGLKHRKAIGKRGGGAFYKWLQDHGWPHGYRVLCHNCNFATHVLGTCPHRDRSAKIMAPTL